jgi:hypothetical protein
MAERASGYDRITDDSYSTPSWVTKALLDAEEFDAPIWECAPGDGHMVRALNEHYTVVIAPPETDFLDASTPDRVRAIITNPPYALAPQFCRRALQLMMPRHGKVAMLLPMSFDCAMGRRDLFADCAQFKSKYVLMRRIRWANIEQKAAGPSQNHAWYIWDWHWCGPPIMKWIP